MAHPCFNCGSECYCHGDIDDVIVSKTPINCNGCGCDDEEFIPCSRCDGHDACDDFGCAYASGLGHLVKKDFL